jgi:hypothetical protein
MLILRTEEFFTFKITDDSSFKAFYGWSGNKGLEIMLNSLRFLSLFDRSFVETVMMMAIYVSNVDFIHPNHDDIVIFEAFAKYHLAKCWDRLEYASSFVYIVNYLTVNDELSNHMWINPYCHAWAIFNYLFSEGANYHDVGHMINSYEWKDTGPLIYLRNQFRGMITDEGTVSYLQGEIDLYIKSKRTPKPVQHLTRSWWRGSFCMGTEWHSEKNICIV